MTDRDGIPLAVIVSGANQHDVNYLLPLVFSEFPTVRGKRGRPPIQPRLVRADCGYRSRDILMLLGAAGIQAEIPQSGAESNAGLGKRRWPVERTLAWLKQYRRVGTRRERKSSHYMSFVQLASALICYKQLIASG